MPRFADCRQPCLSSIGAGMFSKHQFIPRRSKRLKYIKSHSALDFRTSVCSGFSDVRLRPLALTTARVSCRDGWISTGRVRPRSAPRGPGDIRRSKLFGKCSRVTAPVQIIQKYILENVRQVQIKLRFPILCHRLYTEGHVGQEDQRDNEGQGGSSCLNGSSCFPVLQTRGPVGSE